MVAQVVKSTLHRWLCEFSCIIGTWVYTYYFRNTNLLIPVSAVWTSPSHWRGDVSRNPYSRLSCPPYSHGWILLQRLGQTFNALSFWTLKHIRRLSTYLWDSPPKRNKWFFLLQQLSAAISSPGRHRTAKPFPIHAGVLARLVLCRSTGLLRVHNVVATSCPVDSNALPPALLWLYV